jgi:zinc protease
MDMLDEGTAELDALEISDRLDRLGATIASGSNLDTSFVSLSTLGTTVQQSLALFAQVALEPSFPASELERLRADQLDRIRQEQARPNSMGLRVFPRLIYGDGHAYSNPLTGSGTVESVSRIELPQLREFHGTWFKPDHATLVVTGDTTAEAILPLVRATFGAWRPGAVPAKNVAAVALPERNRIYLVDRPGAPQSFLFAAHVTGPRANPDELAIEVMNDILGGGPNSRINMNLREDKHWSYGAYSGLLNARGPRTFYVATSVQTDRTADAIAEVMAEIRSFLDGAPATDVEVAIKKNALTQSLSGMWETASAVGGSIAQIVQYGLPDDYFRTYAGEVAALDTAEVNRVARAAVKPEHLTWVVVGDRARIAPGLRALGYGEPILLDADGLPVGN